MEKLLIEIKQYRKEQAELLDWNKHNGHPVTVSFDEGGLNACDKIIAIIERARAKSDSTSEKDLRVCDVIPRFFDPEINKPLPSKNDITFSDDVFIIDEDGMHGLAYYSFEDCQWKFHTDTLVDYNEVGHETKWKWYYPTFTIKDAF